MTPLLLFLLGCAVTYLGTVSAAFNALMRLSLRIHAERTDRADALAWYLEDPRRLFIPARLLISTLTIFAAALLARATGLDRAGFPLLILSIVTHIGADLAEVRAYLAQPLVAILLLALVINAAIHMHIGLKEIIEDYVHGGAKVVAILLATFFAAVVGLASVVAIVKIGLGS